MPLSYWVDEQLGLFFMNCEGHVTAAELLQFVADRDIEAPYVLDTVVDLSGVTELDLTPENVEWLARGRRGQSRLAIVAPRPMLVGVSRMFQITAEMGGQKSEIAIFATREEAVAWLRAEHAAGEQQCVLTFLYPRLADPQPVDHKLAELERLDARNLHNLRRIAKRPMAKAPMTASATVGAAPCTGGCSIRGSGHASRGRPARH